MQMPSTLLNSLGQPKKEKKQNSPTKRNDRIKCAVKMRYRMIKKKGET